MREVIQLIHEAGPKERGAMDLLLALAAFAEEDGTVKGRTAEDLAAWTRQSDCMIRRHLRQLRREGWAWTFGGRPGQETIYIIDIQRLCRTALMKGRGQVHRPWMERQLGILQFPKPAAVREVKYK